jgi:ribosome modulation factor
VRKTVAPVQPNRGHCPFLAAVRAQKCACGARGGKSDEIDAMASTPSDKAPGPADGLDRAVSQGYTRG